jgi:hypothetical protein
MERILVLSSWCPDYQLQVLINLFWVFFFFFFFLKKCFNMTKKNVKIVFICFYEYLFLNYLLIFLF